MAPTKTLDGIPTTLLLAQLAAWLVGALAATVLAGWLLDVPWLRNALPHGAEMRANAAIGFLLCALALALLARPQVDFPSRVAVYGAGVGIMALGAATLLQDVLGVDLGIDQWVVGDTTPASPSAHAIPGRMSPTTSFAFIVASSAFVAAAQGVERRTARIVVRSCALLLVVIGTIGLIARTSEWSVFASYFNYARISLYGAAAFFVLGVAIFLLLRARTSERWSLDATTTAQLASGGVTMIAMAVVSYQLTNNMRDSTVALNRVQSTLLAVSDLHSRLDDFFMGEARSIVTGSDATFDGREDRKQAVRAAMDRLRTVTADAQPYRQHLDEIEALHVQHIAWTDATLAGMRARQGPDGGAADRPLPGTAFPEAWQRTDALLASIADDVRQALEVRQAHAGAMSRRTFLLMPLSLFLGLTVLALATFTLDANASERLRVAARLAVLKEIDRRIIAGHPPIEIAEAVLPSMRDITRLPQIAVHLFDFQRNEVEWLVGVGRRRTHRGAGYRFPMDLVGDVESLRGGIQFMNVDTLPSAFERERHALRASGIEWLAFIPMLHGEELLGALCLGGPTRDFSDEQIQAGTEVAAQLAISLSQARMSDKVRRADARYREIFDNVPIGIVMTGTNGTLLSANPASARTFGYQSPDEAIAGLRSGILSGFVDAAARNEYVARIAREGLVRDFEARMRRRDGTEVWASISGRAIEGWEGHEQVVVSMVNDITVRKLQELRIARLRRVDAMRSGIGALIVRVRDRQALLDGLCRIAVDEGGMRAAWVGWRDKAARLLRPVASAGYTDGFLDLVTHATHDAPEERPSLVIETLCSGVSRVTGDVLTTPGVDHRQAALERGYRSIMHLPLMIEQVTEGVLVLFADTPHWFDEEERRLLDQLAADMSFALEAGDKSARLEFLGKYDPLTGLPNHRLFGEQIAQSLRARAGVSRPLGIALLDTERFGRFNATFGRPAGDALLREIASRLVAANDSAVRLGGNVFGVLLERDRRIEDMRRSVESLLEAVFGPPFRLDDHEVKVTARVGLSVHPDDGEEADALVSKAEAALRLGKGMADRVVFYTPEMNARVAETLAFEGRLSRAVERREFLLHYQPKVALPDGRLCGIEALIRWHDPDQGMIPPGRFIPLLEETGMIVEVGRWVIARAFEDAQQWKKQGLPVPRIAVNISAIQLQRKDFVDMVLEEIDWGGDNPEWLELEITESLMMRDVIESTGKLSILRGVGVRIAIDDFGTGYSSLSYLSRLPVDSLKIDRSFVSGAGRGSDSEAIVASIIGLAHSIGLNVIAEGVETQAQADLLTSYGCDQAQGYLFSRALPAADITALLRAGVLPL